MLAGGGPWGGPGAPGPPGPIMCGPPGPAGGPCGPPGPGPIMPGGGPNCWARLCCRVRIRSWHSRICKNGALAVLGNF